MSYTINLTSGTSLIPGGLSDGTVDTTHTSLVLIGKNYAGYGQFLNDNFVKLLENFAFSQSPANPLAGQLWWDTTDNVLKVYTGSSWKISTGATSAPASAPPSDLTKGGGDLWFDNTNGQLKVYDGSKFVTIGPAATTATGDSGVVPSLLTDTAGQVHTIIQFRIKGLVYAIFAYENFSTVTPGFTTIVAGMNWNSTNVPAMGLSNQSVAPLAGNLVLRDNNSGIQVGAIAASSGTFTGAISATGGITGSLTGNVSATLATVGTLNATTITAAGGITTSTGFNGTLLTSAQQNITQLGNIYNLSTNGTTNLYGRAYYNGAEIATTGANASITFGFLDSTVIGFNTPSSATFTTVTVGATGVSPGIIPASNAVINLGSSTAFWNGMYANAAIVNQVITSGNITAGANLSVVSNVTAGNLVSRSITTSPTVNAANVNVTSNVFLNNTATLTVFNTVVTGNVTPSANLASNLGSVSNWFNNIYGTAIHAQYADLAERFHADAEYAPGTVVEMGGLYEITQVVEELSDKVFGVISTNAAYLMNSGAGDNLTHPPVAMSGRVPVRVIGFVAKGDRLVSAGQGRARAGKTSEITAFNVIGRSLVDKHSEEECTIEAIVKINS
jgi:hypothetical protein